HDSPLLLLPYEAGFGLGSDWKEEEGGEGTMDIATKIRWFFFVFGLVYFLESIGGFYMTSAVVFIEKQFNIPSRLSGTMVSAGDFAYIPVIIFTSYFGGRGNRAKWIGAGCILISIANFLIAASNFLFPRADYEHDLLNVSDELARRVDKVVGEEFNGTDDMLERTPLMRANDIRVLTALPYAFCDTEINGLRLAQSEGECLLNPPSLGPFLMIFGGLLILGVGRTMPFSLGLPLMDDNVKKDNLPVYFAIMFFAKVLGPVVGLLIGGQLNKIFYNFNPPQGLTPKDPMWIGCWWLGFLIFGFLLFFPSVALYFFPSDSISAKKEDVELEKLNGKNGDTSPKKEALKLNLYDKHKKDHGHLSAKQEFKAFLSTMWELFRVPIYMGSVFGRILDVLAFKGFFVFLSKYLQLQFDMPQHKIQTYVALVGIVGFACGVAGGSGTMRKFRMEGRTAAAWVATCSLCAALLSFANANVGCTNVIGEIGQQGLRTNFTFNSCDKSCGCDDVPLYPVCDSLGNAFYSPCHAGCPLEGKMFNVYNQNDAGSMTPVFSKCKCAAGDGIVSRENCHNPDCDTKFSIFFIFQAIGAFFGGMAVVPGMLIILRSVKPEHRSVSLGFNGFVVSLFATLPSPVLWGKIYDMSCLYWPKFCGDRVGACQLYDLDQLRVRIHLIYGSIRIVSLLSDIWVVYWAKGLKLMDDTEGKEEESESEEKTAIEDDKTEHKVVSRKHSRKPTLPEAEIIALEEEGHNRTL
ncbi:hypothetical protein PRIPAC_75679, partial [Pristionchus pacificus]